MLENKGKLYIQYIILTVLQVNIADIKNVNFDFRFQYSMAHSNDYTPHRCPLNSGSFCESNDSSQTDLHMLKLSARKINNINKLSVIICRVLEHSFMHIDEKIENCGSPVFFPINETGICIPTPVINLCDLMVEYLKAETMLFSPSRYMAFMQIIGYFRKLLRPC